MFSLIITIISIALVAALAVATIYYGGDAFNQGTTKAKASTIVNHAQQIAGANTLYKSNTGGFALDVAALASAGGYLATTPVNQDLSTTYAVSNTNVVTATIAGASFEVCQKVNEVAGIASAAAKTLAEGPNSGTGTTQFYCAGNLVTFKG